MPHTTVEPGMRILLLPPTRRDGEVTAELLANAAMGCVVCPDPAELAQQLQSGAGTIVTTEQGLQSPGFRDVLEALKRQEAWSDIPLVILVHPAALTAPGERRLAALSNVTLLERPARTRTVLSAVQAALRARQRQFQIQRLLKSEQAARRESEHASRLKDEFLATLSHELRTPLSAIFGWTQLLKLSPGNLARVSEAVEVIDRNVRAQTQLIEDLLDMSRIVSGKIRLDLAEVELAEVIHAALEAVRPAIDAKGIQLETAVALDTGAVAGDFGRLRQVLWNLLSNAVKFTPRGGRIRVLAQPVESQIEIQIVDTGEGIAPEFLPQIFERFSQADGSITRQHGGLGLGLSIVKTLVEMHGGSVQASSPGLGLGATFLVRLPLGWVSGLSAFAADRLDVRGSSLTDPEFPLLSGLRILVIDDEPDARELIKRLLTDHEAVPMLAASAQEGRRLLESFEPDVIVSDIGLPGEDGYEFIRTVRAGGAKTPAIALTAFARAEDRVRSLQAGYQAHLTKPVEPTELLAMISRLHQSR